MSKKEKAFKYASTKFVEKEKILGANFADYESIFNKKDIAKEYQAGWDEALKNILVDASKELPEYDIDVWVINEEGEQFYCHRSKNKRVKAYKDEWCNYTGSDIIAWFRPISFEEILKLNKDVLKRLKNK